MNWAKSEIARLVGPQDVKGSLAEVIKGADVFIGLSAGGLVSREMVASMAKDPIVFALALPEPEISEAEAKAGGAAVVATGQADSENQIRSSLVTPGFFRGCLDVGAHRVNIEMYLAAARALADMIPEDQLSPQQYHSPADGLAHFPGHCRGGGPGGPGNRGGPDDAGDRHPGKDSRAHRKLYL